MTILHGSNNGGPIPARRIAASSPAMRSAVQALATANRSIEHELETLERQVAQLSGNWDDEAQDEYEGVEQGAIQSVNAEG